MSRTEQRGVRRRVIERKPLNVSYVKCSNTVFPENVYCFYLLYGMVQGYAFLLLLLS